MSVSMVGEEPKKYCVLYIEDTPANLRLVNQVLTLRPNIHMLEAEEAEKGIELAVKHIPDLILLDINLPGMNGFEALEKLRLQEITQEIPVIAISANAMKADIQEGLSAGFDGYICKPFDIQKLLETVVNTLEKNGNMETNIQ